MVTSTLSRSSSSDEVAHKNVDFYCLSVFQSFLEKFFASQQKIFVSQILFQSPPFLIELPFLFFFPR